MTHNTDISKLFQTIRRNINTVAGYLQYIEDKDANYHIDHLNDIEYSIDDVENTYADIYDKNELLENRNYDLISIIENILTDNNKCFCYISDYKNIEEWLNDNNYEYDCYFVTGKQKILIVNDDVYTILKLTFSKDTIGENIW